MNIRLYYLYSVLKNLVLVFPVYLLLFSSRGMSVGQISLLLSIWSIPLIILEIPTGILSDMWSRKNMVVISALLHAACCAIWVFSHSFWLFALGFIVWGISEAFASGSIEALVFDSLKQEKKEATFAKVYGIGQFLCGAAIAVSMLTGGILSEVAGMSFVLVLSVAIILIAALTALFFKDIRLPDDLFGNKSSHKILKESKNVLVGAAKFLKKRFVFLLVLLAVTFIGTAGLLDEYDQLIAARFVPGLAFVGLWLGFRYILESIGSLCAHRIRRLFYRANIKNPLWLLWSLGFGATIGLLVFTFAGTRAFVAGYFLYFFLMSVAWVLCEDTLQQTVRSEGRATVHSLFSLLHNLYGSVSFAAIGLVLLFSPDSLLLVVSIYHGILCLIFIPILLLGQKARTD